MSLPIVPSSVPQLIPSAVSGLQNYTNNDTTAWAANGSGPVGVSQIVAGSGITVGPTGGTGVVTVSTVAASPFVQGMIMMWDKTSAYPPGWFICDGTIHNGYTTPTLLDKFVLSVGPSNPTVGLGGGAASVALTLNMIPDHTHSSGELSTTSGSAGGGGFSFAAAGTTSGISNAGYTPGTAVPTLPPYVTYAYICYCGIAP
jgi:hypothetical protein